MKIGIFGGAFNPVHYGHLVAAEQCREQGALDAVWFVPCGNPPHRDAHALAPGDCRVQMLEMATAFNPYFAIKRLELEREGISYTIDTLNQIHRANPEYELYLLMDTDWLVAFPTWYRPREIAELATLMTVNRGNRTTVDLEPLREILTPEAIDRIIFVQMPEMSLSASDIRRRIRQKLSVRYLTPRSVVEYIMQHRLYTDEYARL